MAAQELVAVKPDLHFKDEQMKVCDQEALVSGDEHFSREEAAETDFASGALRITQRQRIFIASKMSAAVKKKKGKKYFSYSEWERKRLRDSVDFHSKEKWSALN